MNDGYGKPLFIIKAIKEQTDKILKGIDDVKNMFQSASGADFAASDLREGKKAFSGTALVTGTMKDNGNISKALDGTNNVYTIPAGFHDGNGTVSVDTQTKTASLSTAAQTVKPDTGKLLSAVTIPAVGGNAAKDNVLAGKTFNSATAGIDQTGTMADHSGTTQAATGSILNSLLRLLIPSKGYYNEASYLTIDPGTATKAHVLASKTFTSTAGVKQAGTMPNKSGTSVEVTEDQITTDDENIYLPIPVAGYYDTSSKLFTKNSNLGGIYKGTFTSKIDSPVKVVLGFKPKKLIIFEVSAHNYEDGVYKRWESGDFVTKTFPNTAVNQLNSIQEDGFVFGSRQDTAGKCYYIAMK